MDILPLSLFDPEHEMILTLMLRPKVRAQTCLLPYFCLGHVTLNKTFPVLACEYGGRM